MRGWGGKWGEKRMSGRWLEAEKKKIFVHLLIEISKEKKNWRKEESRKKVVKRMGGGGKT